MRQNNCPVIRDKSGYTLIEILISLTVLVIFLSAVTAIIQIILSTLGESRVRATALELAQEQLETVVNMPYNSIGTEGGIPSGSIPAETTVRRNGTDFTVTASVVFIDDPYDGLSPADTVNTDYKRVRIQTSWGGTYPSRQPIVLITNIAPRGTESDLPGGTLEIRVFDSQGLPVPNATVTVDNASVSPEIHTETLTDNNGSVVLPGAAVCNACYRISATKWGYSTDRTYSTGEVKNPLLPYVSVSDGLVSRISLSVDKVSTLTVNSYNTAYHAVANVIFTLKGNKIIGYDVNDLPVYKYSQNSNTGGYTVQISALEWDTYTLSFGSSAHTLAGSNPVLPITVAPDTDREISVVVVPKSAASLLVTVEDPFGSALASASATLTNSSAGYSQTRITPDSGMFDFGHAFFPSLTPATYSLTVTLPGYTEATASVNISTNQSKTIYLNTL